MKNIILLVFVGFSLNAFAVPFPDSRGEHSNNFNPGSNIRSMQMARAATNTPIVSMAAATPNIITTQSVSTDSLIYKEYINKYNVYVQNLSSARQVCNSAETLVDSTIKTLGGVLGAGIGQIVSGTIGVGVGAANLYLSDSQSKMSDLQDKSKNGKKDYDDKARIALESDYKNANDLVNKKVAELAALNSVASNQNFNNVGNVASFNNNSNYNNILASINDKNIEIDEKNKDIDDQLKTDDKLKDVWDEYNLAMDAAVKQKEQDDLIAQNFEQKYNEAKTASDNQEDVVKGLKSKIIDLENSQDGSEDLATLRQNAYNASSSLADQNLQIDLIKSKIKKLEDDLKNNPIGSSSADLSGLEQAYTEAAAKVSEIYAIDIKSLDSAVSSARQNVAAEQAVVDKIKSANSDYATKSAEVANLQAEFNKLATLKASYDNLKASVSNAQTAVTNATNSLSNSQSKNNLTPVQTMCVDMRTRFDTQNYNISVNGITSKQVLRNNTATMLQGRLIVLQTAITNGFNNKTNYDSYANEYKKICGISGSKPIFTQSARVNTGLHFETCNGGLMGLAMLYNNIKDGDGYACDFVMTKADQNKSPDALAAQTALNNANADLTKRKNALAPVETEWNKVKDNYAAKETNLVSKRTALKNMPSSGLEKQLNDANAELSKRQTVQSDAEKALADANDSIAKLPQLQEASDLAKSAWESQKNNSSNDQNIQYDLANANTELESANKELLRLQDLSDTANKELEVAIGGQSSPELSAANAELELENNKLVSLRSLEADILAGWTDAKTNAETNFTNNQSKANEILKQNGVEGIDELNQKAEELNQAEKELNKLNEQLEKLDSSVPVRISIVSAQPQSNNTNASNISNLQNELASARSNAAAIKSKLDQMSYQSDNKIDSENEQKNDNQNISNSSIGLGVAGIASGLGSSVSGVIGLSGSQIIVKNLDDTSDQISNCDSSLQNLKSSGADLQNYADNNYDMLKSYTEYKIYESQSGAISDLNKNCNDAFSSNRFMDVKDELSTSGISSGVSFAGGIGTSVSATGSLAETNDKERQKWQLAGTISSGVSGVSGAVSTVLASKVSKMLATEKNNHNNCLEALNSVRL